MSLNNSVDQYAPQSPSGGAYPYRQALIGLAVVPFDETQVTISKHPVPGERVPIEDWRLFDAAALLRNVTGVFPDESVQVQAANARIEERKMARAMQLLDPAMTA